MNNSNPISKISWIFAVIATCLVGLNNKQQTGQPLSNLSLTIYIVMGIAIVFGIFGEFFYKLFIGLVYSFRKIYTDFIYSCVDVKIKYLNDDGSLVSYYRHDHLDKLSLRKSRRMVTLPVEFEGTIIRDSVSAINSSFSFPSNNSLLFQTYIKNTDMIGKEHHGTYSFCVEDAFTKNSEYWIFKSYRYCKRYNLKVVIPNTRKITEATVMKGNKINGELFSLDQENRVWSKIDEPKIMTIKSQTYTTISVKLTGVLPTEMYKIAWTLK